MSISHHNKLDSIFPIIGITRSYTAPKAKADVIAATTVALFTIPQAMAYALIAGFPPTMGIYSAIVASIFGALFGSSEFLINGPTNAISVMIASNVALLASQGDPQKLVIFLTLIVGIGQCIGAMLKAGTLTRFVSEPVLIGFTAGAGVYIAVNQLPSALGIEKKALASTLWGWKPPSDVLFDLMRTLASLASSNLAAIAVAAATIIMVRLLLVIDKPGGRRIPATFLTLVVITVITFALGMGTATGPMKIKIVKDIQEVTRALPNLQLPEFTLDRFLSLLGPAFAIAVLGAVEAVAIGKALAAEAGHRFSANRQLVGEGLCNIASAMVGGFASSGSFSRTAVNYEAGAVTRWSCILSGILVLLLILALAPLANVIPIAALAGLVIHIGFRLVNVGKVRYIFKATNADRIVMVATFLGVLLLPQLEQALFLGVGIALMMALRRAESFKLRLYGETESGLFVEKPMTEAQNEPLITLDLQGELYFAAAEVLEHRLKALLHQGHPFMVLRLQQAYNMDITCADALIHVSKEAERLGGRLVLSGVRTGTFEVLQRAGVVKALGEDAVFVAEPTLLGSTTKAVAFARNLVGNANAS